MPTPAASLTVLKVLPCAPAEAYRAWTEPALFAQWFTPQPGVRATARMDVKQGGQYEIQFHRPGKPAPMLVHGEFLIVAPGRYLEYTWLFAWDETPSVINHSVVKVTFTDLGSHRTELSLTHEGFTDPEDVSGHEQGWTSVLDCLAAALNEGRALS